MKVCVFYFFGLALAQQPAFEVASIKPFNPVSNQMWTSMTADAGMVRYTNISLRACIRAAYRVRDFQVKGPDWMDDARFDISAKLPAGARLDQIPEMMQALLAERFKLVLSHDFKDQPVYALVISQGGPTLKRAVVNDDNRATTSLGPDGKPRSLVGYLYLPSGVRITATSATLSSLADVMSKFTEKPVVDMTGIDGSYEIEFTFVPENARTLVPPGTTAPDGREIFSEPGIALVDALRKQGLKIENRKAPIEILTVNHLEHLPTDN
jgi:uncharacterized protein (TIGR03435 family)